MRVPAPLLSFALSALALCAGGVALAQAPASPPPRNPLGIAFNHVSIEVPDYDAHVKFWTGLGGVQRQMAPAPGAPQANAGGRFTFIDFPDMIVAVRDGTGTAGTVGSVINHIGIQVPDTQQAAARFRAAGLTVEDGARPEQVFAIAPDGVRVEVLQDPALKVPVRGHHIHFFNASPLETQAWYAKIFGAVPGKRGNFDAANITASYSEMNLSFTPSPDPVAPTNGRALNHIGFAVNGLEAAMRRMQAEGAQFEGPMQLLANGRTGIAYLKDPWGTRIELVDQNAGPGK